MHHVISPEADTGRRVAHLVNGKLLDYIEFDDGFAIVKMKPPPETIGFTLEQSQIRSKYGVTVVGVKAPGEDFTYAVPETKVTAHAHAHRQRPDRADRAARLPSLSRRGSSASWGPQRSSPSGRTMAISSSPSSSLTHAHRTAAVGGTEAEAAGEGDGAAVVGADPVDEVAAAVGPGRVRRRPGRAAWPTPVPRAVGAHPEAEELADLARRPAWPGRRWRRRRAPVAARRRSRCGAAHPRRARSPRRRPLPRRAWPRRPPGDSSQGGEADGPVLAPSRPRRGPAR